MDTRFVRLRLLDLLKSEHALQVHEQAHDYTDLREVLAAIPERAMVLLGAPGSGKTTLLRRLQWDHAADGLAAGDAQVSLFVSLGHYPADPDPLAQAPAPLAWLAELWHKRAPALPGLETLLAGGRVLLLLDALNEMPHRDRDNFAQRVERWRTFLRDDFPPGNMAVFSCRSLDYSEPLSVKDDYAVRQVRVQPLNPGQIEKFLHLHAPEQAARAWSDIRAKPRLVDLYSTPYFLKLLCDQLAYDPRVAGERAALFTGFVRRALEREIAGNNPLFVRDGVLVARDRERINRRAWADAHDLPHKGPLIDRLQALAYAMQERLGASDGKQVVLARDMALDYLDHTQAENILKAAEQLTLLDEDLRTDQVWFYHQLLQEYFAARRLAVQPADVARLAASEWRADVMQPTLADKLAGLQDFEPLPPPDPTGWEETALLACGMTQNPAAFVAGLADTNLVLAARCALELAATGRAGQIALGPLQHRLLERSRDPNCDLRARIAAARALGELGDPRFERRTGKFGDYLLPPRVNIPAGDYPLGSDEGIEADEAPAHRVPVAAFALARFQVTNAEWKCFMEGGGYENVRWWQGEAAARWQRGDGVADGPKQQQREVRQFLRSKPGHIDALLAERRITSEQARDWRKWYIDMGDEEFDVQLDDWYPSGIRREPAQWNDPSFNHAAQPVVGICWHEARAYCAWLSAQTGQFWRLPSEAEWEGAAAGLAARRFAWGNEFDTSRCNSFESHVRGTTPVGVFPAGDTPDGLADLSGNVWEWTGSAYRPYRYVAADGRENSEDGELLRVVRGGSWFYFRGGARCTFRNRYHPGNRSLNLGFRVLCVSPIF